MRFEWDLKKAAGNVRKHQVSFEQACRVFSDESVLSLFDREHSGDEDRWITMGRVFPRNILVVTHTYCETGNEEVVRIISARKATARERRLYLERKL